MLEEIKATHLPLLTVWNKVDACVQPDKIREIAARRPNTVAVSAEQGEGIQGLLEAIEQQLAKQLKNVHLLVPYTQARPCCIDWQTIRPTCHVARKVRVQSVGQGDSLVSLLVGGNSHQGRCATSGGL